MLLDLIKEEIIKALETDLVFPFRIKIYIPKDQMVELLREGLLNAQTNELMSENCENIIFDFLNHEIQLIVESDNLYSTVH